LGLFLAICDDRNLQERLIQRYETELSQQGFATYDRSFNRWNWMQMCKTVISEFSNFPPTGTGCGGD
jgi:hypothetical protein